MPGHALRALDAPAVREVIRNARRAAGVFLEEPGTKRRLRSPLGRISTISLSRFFHSPASPEDPPWARACRRRIASGVTAIRLFREKIQSSAARYPASSSSERSRGLALPITRGRNRFAATVTPSIRFYDSALWTIACFRNTPRTSGFCPSQRSCFPRASIQTPRSQPVPIGIAKSANPPGSSVNMSNLPMAPVA